MKKKFIKIYKSKFKFIYLLKKHEKNYKMNIKISYILLYSSNIPSKKGTKKIYCRVRCGKKVRVFSLNREVQVENWDRKSGGVSGLVPGASLINGYLDIVEQSIKAICIQNPSVLEYRKTFQKLLKEEIARRQTDFHEAFLNFLEQKSKGYTLSTVRKWKSLMGLLEKFSSVSGGILTLSGIHTSFLTSFRSYLLHVIDQSDQTVSTYFRMLGSFLEWAGMHGYRTEIHGHDIHELLNPVGYDGNELTCLSEEDLTRLEGFVKSYPKDPEVILLLSVCYTGMRAEEIRHLNRNSISDAVLHVPGKKERNIYLSENEKGTIQLFLSFLVNGFYGRIYQAKLNKMLRSGARKAGLQRNVTQIRHKLGEPQVKVFPLWKMITMETARRTFLNRLKLKNLPMDKVLEMSGCTAPSALVRYF